MKKAFSLIELIVVIAIIAILGAIIVPSVRNSGEHNELPKVISNSGTGDYKIEVIDGCQYITRREKGFKTGWGFMAHKGNCNNTIHVYREH